MRKKAVGLLGNAKGAAKPIPFAEDTCVPPEHLADYIVEFRALLDGHGLSYGMVRPCGCRRAARASGAGYVRSAARDADETHLR
ncbi:FAD-linked oxidase C-terminal domain-containing protein [Escherichia coli]